MKVLFICQVVDRAHPALAHIPSWIDSLRRQPKVTSLAVISLRRAPLDATTTADTVAYLPPGGKVRRAIAFLRLVLQMVSRGEVDRFFVCQGGVYPLLLLPFRLLYRVPIFQWKAHSHVSLLTKLSVRVCNRKTFTPTPASLPYRARGIVVTGHGIDTSLFSPAPMGMSTPRQGIVAIGRIDPVKNIPAMLKLLAHHRDHFGWSPHLTLYGAPTDATYLEYLHNHAERFGVNDLVTFHGPIRREGLPAILSAAQVMLFFCAGALGKAVLEGFACGLPALTTNEAVGEILPPRLKSLLLIDSSDLIGQSRRLNELLTQPAAAASTLAAELRELVVRDHSLDRLFAKIAIEMEEGSDV